jgi:hypothetical protein
MSPSLDWLGAPRISSLEFSPPRPWLRQWHEQRRPRLSRHWRNSKRVSPDGRSNNSPHPVRKGHSFGEPGDLDHHAAHVHSFFFPIPVAALEPSSRVPIWTAAQAANGRPQHNLWPCARRKTVARSVAEPRVDRAQSLGGASAPPRP